VYEVKQLNNMLSLEEVPGGQSQVFHLLCR